MVYWYNAVVVQSGIDIAAFIDGSTMMASIAHAICSLLVTMTLLMHHCKSLKLPLMH